MFITTGLSPSMVQDSAASSYTLFLLAFGHTASAAGMLLAALAFFFFSFFYF
jgi:hypothetical protein